MRILERLLGRKPTVRAPAPVPAGPGGPAVPAGPAGPGGPAAPAGLAPYAGDFTGVARLAYAPQPDGRPDPGEIVWAWVPFEEDHQQGKDRPVLIIAREPGHLLGLMLTSKDHDRDHEQEARHGRHWLDVGAGPWDRERRPSEVRLDRILQLDEAAVRREGAVLDRATYERVAEQVRVVHRW